MIHVEPHGVPIPALGLGTFGLNGRVAERIVGHALDAGYRHVDTAQMYDNEREVGEGVRASGVPRGEVFVTTKIWPTHFAPNDLLRSLKESLAKLRMTEADLVLLHWPSPRVPLNETLDALNSARQAGLAKHIGISNFNVALVEEAVSLSQAPLACNQVEYHPYRDQSELLDACRRHGLAAVAYSPIAKGRVKDDRALARIGDIHRKTAAQVCLRWLVQQNIAAIPRTSKLERLQENLSVFDFALSDDDMARISAMGSRGAGR